MLMYWISSIEFYLDKQKKPNNDQQLSGLLFGFLRP